MFTFTVTNKVRLAYTFCYGKGTVIVMEYKDLVTFTNAVMLANAQNAYKMFENMTLIQSGLASTFQLEAAKLLNDLKYEGEGLVKHFAGKDLKDTIETFSKAMVKLGFCQKFEIVELTEEKVEIDIGYCLFGVSNVLIREGAERMGLSDLENNPPPCALIAMLEGMLRKNTGKNLTIVKVKRVDKENLEKFSITID